MATFLVWAAIAGLVCGAIYTQIRWRDIARLAARAQARCGAMACTRVAVVLALLAGINYLAARRNTTWDLTEDRRYSAPASTATTAQPTAYFTSGHGERDPTSTERFGYSAIASLLEQRNFTIDGLELSQPGSVPADATLVIVAGPKIDFVEPEIDALTRYVTSGGNVLFLIDPVADLKRYVTESGTVLFMIDPEKKTDTPELRRLVDLIREWGAELGNDIVVDLSGMGEFLGTDASVPVAARYPGHAITDRFSVLTAFPVARSVTPVADDRAGATAAHVLIETSDRSWGRDRRESTDQRRRGVDGSGQGRSPGAYFPRRRTVSARGRP